MRTIQIFLASSIDELRNDRIELATEFTAWIDFYLDNSKTRLKLVRGEAIDKALSLRGAQTQLNEIIIRSDIVFFLFGKKVGKYTKEEFDIALAAFRHQGNPLIYTYFKKVDQAEESVDAIKIEFEKMGHYYRYYEHISQVEMWMRKAIDDFLADADLGEKKFPIQSIPPPASQFDFDFKSAQPNLSKESKFVHGSAQKIMSSDSVGYSSIPLDVAKHKKAREILISVACSKGTIGKASNVANRVGIARDDLLAVADELKNAGKIVFEDNNNGTTLMIADNCSSICEETVSSDAPDAATCKKVREILVSVACSNGSFAKVFNAAQRARISRNDVVAVALSLKKNGKLLFDEPKEDANLKLGSDE